MGRLQHKCNRLRLLATCSNTITLKVITITIAITFNKPHLHGLMEVYFQTTDDINECNKRNY